MVLDRYVVIENGTSFLTTEQTFTLDNPMKNDEFYFVRALSRGLSILEAFDEKSLRILIRESVWADDFCHAFLPSPLFYPLQKSPDDLLVLIGLEISETNRFFLLV